MSHTLIFMNVVSRFQLNLVIKTLLMNSYIFRKENLRSWKKNQFIHESQQPFSCFQDYSLTKLRSVTTAVISEVSLNHSKVVMSHEDFWGLIRFIWFWVSAYTESWSDALVTHVNKCNKQIQVFHSFYFIDLLSSFNT